MSTNNTCANCGKGEECSGDLKSCTACKLVKYCNRECQIAHRPQHKKECKKQAAELRDEKLFKQPHNPKSVQSVCYLHHLLTIIRAWLSSHVVGSVSAMAVN